MITNYLHSHCSRSEKKSTHCLLCFQLPITQLHLELLRDREAERVTRLQPARGNKRAVAVSLFTPGSVVYFGKSIRCFLLLTTQHSCLQLQLGIRLSRQSDGWVCGARQVKNMRKLL